MVASTGIPLFPRGESRNLAVVVVVGEGGDLLITASQGIPTEASLVNGRLGANPDSKDKSCYMESFVRAKRARIKKHVFYSQG